MDKEENFEQAAREYLELPEGSYFWNDVYLGLDHSDQPLSDLAVWFYNKGLEHGKRK